MPISAVVITLHDDPITRRQALTALTGHDSVEVGQPIGPRAPIVIASETNDGMKRTLDWARQLPGVGHLELVYALGLGEKPPQGDAP